MSVLTNTEVDKLSVMYDGDKDRDAADKVRGFLFQDYVTIMCLLQDHVEYVCSEYLEDVDVFFEDGIFEFIQVKYYPKTSPKMKEISTDLYYQYLRLQMLQSNLTAVPRLYIHRKPKVEKPTLDEMKTYIDLGSALSKSVTYSNTVVSTAWLRTNVYSTNKKEEQKKKLFATMASEDSLKEFVAKFDVIHQQDINQYKKKLMEKLAKAYPNPDKDGDEEHWQFILLGLAISYIQRRYTLVNPVFDQLRVDKKEFDHYMTESATTKTEQTIVSYLAGIVCEEYGEIINNNDLSDLQTRMLNMICKNTIQWINKIGKTVNGQYQLLNTYSTDDVSKIADYRGAPVDDRLLYIAECKQDFRVFLAYLWKIMLNICQEKVNNETEISAHMELFDPFHYMVHSITDYVCLNFPEDKYVNHSVILPRAGGNFKGVKRKIVERMVNMSPKPEKWFFENSKLTKGKNYYNYSTANVNENPTVADLGEDSFYIECMDCIGIDEDEWSIREICDDCIFFCEMCQRGKVVMILQEEFKKSGYKDILVGDIASEYEINLEDIFDLDQKPEELLCIFISEQRDDLFFLLDGDRMDIDSLCDRWDDRIRVFTIINGKSKEIHKLKYNIVQLIVYSGDTPNKNRESNLLISRKIIIKGDMTDKDQIVIDDEEVIELPFHMIPADAFAPDEDQVKQLGQLLPGDEGLLALMEKKQKRVNRKEKEGVLDKSFEVQDYEKIKEWLKR